MLKFSNLPLLPIVIAAIHDDAADGCAMSADEFGGGVGDDVRAPFKRAEEIRRGEGIVNEQNEFMFLRDLGNFFEREDGNIRVAQCFAVYDLCVGLNRRFKILRVGWVNEGHFNAEFGKRVLELVVRAAIQTR